MMQLNLVPHPTTPPTDPDFKVWASVDHAASLGAVATTNIWFGVGTPADRFVIPESEAAGRKDELWKTTCFEAFLRGEGEDAYREWNFSPTGDWNAYDFSSYRQEMAEADVAAPYIRVEDNMTWWTLGATFPTDAERAWRLGLSAILEEQDGTRSYWALAHPDPDKPDFHAPDCFTAKLG